MPRQPVHPPEQVHKRVLASKSMKQVAILVNNQKAEAVEPLAVDAAGESLLPKKVLPQVASCLEINKDGFYN